MLRSMKDQLKVSSVIAAASVTASGTSSSVDMQDFGSLSFAVAVGATSGNDLDASHKLALKMLESDDNSTFTDVDGDDIYDAETAASDIAKMLDSTADASSVHLVHYRGNKRYVKLNIVETGTVSVPLAVLAIRGHAKVKPPL